MNAVVKYDSLEEAFPNVDPNYRPFGSRVLVQIRTPKKVSKGGIALIHETQDTEMWNTQVAKVISLGSVAYRDRDTLAPWPEGDWVTPGMYIRCPMYGGDRWFIPVPGKTDYAHFAAFKDLEMGGEVPDPLSVVAFV